MPKQIILPRTFVETKEPLIFLAGPIHSAKVWRDMAMEMIWKLAPEMTIVSPAEKIAIEHESFVASGKTDHFHRQRAWERHYLDVAARNGCIMFWLPKEDPHNCEKVYGAMTRIEIGACLAWYKQNPATRFCIGSDGYFPEFDIIQYDMSLDAPDKVVFHSLEETCKEAVRLALPNYALV